MSNSDPSWMEIEQQLDRIARLDAKARKEAIAALRVENPSLADEVQSLLQQEVQIQQHQSKQTFESTTLIATGNPPDSGPSGAGMLNFRPGDRVAQFELLYPVAKSSCSEVWYGVASNHASIDDGTAIAIKFLRVGELGESWQWQNEAAILQTLDHPNIAKLLSYGLHRIPETEHDLAWLVTEWVDGQTIDHWCNQQQLSVPERVNVVVDLLQAIEHAHQRLVVHCDMKPGNLLIDAEGQPRIIDFGAARQTQEATPKRLTDSDQSMMTPAWAAPEQIRGEPITIRADLHAIGLVLFKLLCGHHPFSDEAHPQTPKMFDRICYSSPIQPSELVVRDASDLPSNAGRANSTNPQLIAGHRLTTPKRLARILRGDLDAIVLKAIAKDPKDRYSTSEQFCSDLNAWLTGRSVSANLRNKPILESVRQRPFRWLIGTSLVTLAIAGIIGGTLLLGYQRQLSKSKQQLHDTLDRAVRAEQNAQQADSQLDRLLSSGKKLTPLQRSIGLLDHLAKRERYPEADELLQQILPDDIPGFAKSLSDDDLIRLSNAAVQIGRHSQAILLLDRYSELSASSLDRLETENSNMLCSVMVRMLEECGWEAGRWQQTADTPLVDGWYGKQQLSCARIAFHDGDRDAAIDFLQSASMPGVAASLSVADRRLLEMLLAWIEGTDIEALMATDADGINSASLFLLEQASDKELLPTKLILAQNILEKVSNSARPYHPVHQHLHRRIAYHFNNTEQPAMCRQHTDAVWDLGQQHQQFGTQPVFEYFLNWADDDPKHLTKVWESVRPYDHWIRAMDYSLQNYCNSIYQLAAHNQQSDLQQQIVNDIEQLHQRTGDASPIDRAMLLAYQYELSPNQQSSQRLEAAVRALPDQPSSPAGVLAALATDEAALQIQPPSLWLAEHQRYANNSLDNQYGTILYLLSDQAKNQKLKTQLVSRKLRPLIEQMPADEDHRDSWYKAMASCGLIQEIRPQLEQRLIDGTAIQRDLAASHLVLGMHLLGQDDSAISLAEKLGKQLKPDTDNLCATIWTIGNRVRSLDEIDRAKRWDGIDLNQFR